ncbi:MAG: SIR2 family protein [Methylococcales bacterium]|nr:SIR2 family protein [Methylococcales bacterium]
MSDKKEILKEIIEEASYRPVVPFFGAGVSISAGFPTIRFVIEYLAKVDFAIQFGVFEDRFPNIKEEDLLAVETYRRHPSKYLEDFGWPNLGQLNNDIWEWLGRQSPEDEKKVGTTKGGKKKKPKNGLGRDKILEKSENALIAAITAYKKLIEDKPNENLADKRIFPDLLIYDVYLMKDKETVKTIKDISKIISNPLKKTEATEADEIGNKTSDDRRKNISSYSGQRHNITTKIVNQPLDFRDHQRAIVQWVLRSELFGREDGTNPAVLKSWLQWKHHYFSDNEYYSNNDGCDELEPKLLYGDWEMLLDRLCEGNLNLVDTLFTSFENGLNPTLSHRFLSFLQPKLGIPLLLTTNFDSLLERAFRQEGIPPKVFDIHRDAELPNPDLVHRQLSLLKLHGSAYGLRFGERLKYTLESDARNNALGYIPKDALMLVMGFNGSERRIMQMLQAFVQEREPGAVKPRLIWIQGPSGRVENRLSPALPHQTVHALLTHTAFRCSSHQGMRCFPASLCRNLV